MLVLPNVPAAVASSRREDALVSTASPTPASSSCWRWASTSSSAWPACSTWATRRSSRSARTCTPTRTRRSRDMDLPFLPMLVVGAAVAAVFGIAARRADPAAARRLPGDHDPRLRRDRADRLPEPRQVHRGHQRHRRHLPAGGAAAPRRVLAAHPVRLLRPDGGHRDDRDDPALPAAGFADRPSLERDPRGRAGRRGQRHQHRHHEAARVRPRRHDGRSGRRLQRLEAHASSRPDQFLFTVSFIVLAMVILGGMGNIWGVAAGRVHRLHDPDPSSSSSSTRSSTALEHPDPQGHQLPRATSSSSTASPWS